MMDCVATATSSAVACNVRFEAVAELTSMAEIGRKPNISEDRTLTSTTV